MNFRVGLTSADANRESSAHIALCAVARCFIMRIESLLRLEQRLYEKTRPLQLKLTIKKVYCRPEIKMPERNMTSMDAYV
jgi:hypothetical protein